MPPPPHHCRYCGQPIDVPQMFTMATQRIFRYIWDNPGSSIADIIHGVYSPRCIGKTKVVSVHIYRIRQSLADSDYELLRYPHENPGRCRYRYHIARRPTALAPTSPPNVSPDLSPRVR